MSRFYGLVGIGLLTAMFSGCAMCCTPYDDHYLYQGGKWQRTVPNSGRVGSAFDPAGDMVTTSTPAGPIGAPAPAAPVKGAMMMDESEMVPGVEYEVPSVSQRMPRQSGMPVRSYSRAGY